MGVNEKASLTFVGQGIVRRKRYQQAIADTITSWCAEHDDLDVIQLVGYDERVSAAFATALDELNNDL